MVGRFCFIALLALAADALRVPSAGPTGTTGRRAAAAQLGGALLFLTANAPAPASAKYRPSLAEFKGQGSSPLLDELGEPTAPKTSLSHAELVANTVNTQEKALGRKLAEDEIKAIDAKITKFFPTAK